MGSWIQKPFILKSGTQVCPVSMVLFNLVLDVLCRAQNKQKRKQKKKEKDTQIKRNHFISLMFLWYDSILKKSQESHQKNLYHLTYKYFQQSSMIKTSIQKWIYCLQINNKLSRTGIM